MAKKGVVNIRGNEYHTVAHRVGEFRKEYPIKDKWCIRTWLVNDDGDRVVVQAAICDADDHVVANGMAEEVRGSSMINKTSALENAETSAIGRALAAAGYGGGGEYCSADELVSALKQQREIEAKPEPKEEPEPREEKPKATKFDPRKRCEKWLDKLEGLVGEDEAREKFIRLMKRSDHTDGALSLNGVKDFGKMRELSEEIKDVVVAVEKKMNEEEE